MKCSNCGCILKTGDIICPICGQQVADLNDNAPSYEMPVTVSRRERKNRRYEPETTTIKEENYEENAPKKSGIRKFMIGFLITVLILGAAALAMFLAYNYFMKDSNSEYLSSVSKLDDSINKINDDLAAVLNNDGALPTDNILSQLAPTYNALDDVTTKISGITAPSSFASSHQKLLDAVKLNKIIYQQLESIIKKPVDTNVADTISSFTQNIDTCMNDYLSIDIKGIDISMPDEIQNLPQRVDSWVQLKQTEYAQVASLIASFTKYFDAMSKILVSYDSSKVDISQSLNTAKADRTSWSKVLSLIDSSEAIVKTAKDTYSKLQIPSQLTTFNKDFLPILDDTLGYYAKLREAVQADMEFDKTGMTPEDITKKTNDIAALYQDAEKLNSSSSMNYQKFASSFSAQKDKFMDPAYVMTLKYNK